MSNGNLNIDLGNGNDVSDITNLTAAAIQLSTQATEMTRLDF